MNNFPKVVAQQRRGRASNPRLLYRKSDALPLSHRAMDIIRAVKCIHGPCCDKNIFAVMYVSLCDGPYTLL